MSSKPSKVPAWGGGSGSRMASQAVASKLRSVRDVASTRSASSMGFREERPASSSSAGWGFSASAPELQEEESCPATTPAVTPVKTVTPSKGGEPRTATSVKALDNSFDQSNCGAPTASLLVNPRAALEQLARKLGAAARGHGVLELGGATWEEAFLAGVAVGLQLPTAGRNRNTAQSMLLGVVVVSALVVLAGSALLLAGFTQAHPSTVYHT